MSPDEGEKRNPLTETMERRQRRATGTHRAIHSLKAQHARDRTRLEIAADWLTRVSSSPFFLALHVLWFAIWIFWNVGFLGFRPFDPFPFGLLTMIVSLEAIFLSIFVLMSQGRDAEIAELREEIALQVNLRTEEEVTKTLQLVAGLYGRLGHEFADDPELTEMLAPLDADDIERQLAMQIREARMNVPHNKK
ncbi:MAG: DUF1003 domain-containing protein [Gemmatimonadota bacterium]|nr:DUF1003 domain-containing protein [Gemmatimonadota bacterium]